MARYDDNPWARLEELAQGMDRLGDAQQGCPGGLRQPLANVLETAEAFVIEVELPGVRQEDVAVELTGTKLVVAGETRLEKDAQGGEYHVMERCHGPFGRRFVLPRGVDGERVSAVFAQGLLTITVPKKKRDSNRTITIEISD